MPKALISGVAGQDGTYLSQFLMGKGYEVHGLISSNQSADYLRHRELLSGVNIHQMDITDFSAVGQIIQQENFDEVYNLASLSSPSQSFEQPFKTFHVNTQSVLNFLESIRRLSSDTRFYQASSSELFGGMPEDVPQHEGTRFHPRSPYGVSKLAAHWLVINYREAYNMPCCAGILFNHESPRRQGSFVTKKICDWVKSYRRREHKGPLMLGNVNARRDWGHSKDFVRAMWMMLNTDKLDEPYRKRKPVYGEYVVGTGRCHSIKEFITLALRQCSVAIEWKITGKFPLQHGREMQEIDLEEAFAADGEKLVGVSEEYWRPAEVIEVRAESFRIREELGWEPDYTLEEIIAEMLEGDSAKD